MIETLLRNEPGRSQAAGSQGRSATVAVTITSPARTAVSASAAMRTSTLGCAAPKASASATAAVSFRS